MKLIVFIATALLITLPWFIHPGYLLLLDWSGVPHPPIELDQTGGISGIPLTIIWNIALQITGSPYAQLGLVFIMLILAGATTSLLVDHLIPHTRLQGTTLISIAAGIFAMTNPFMFNRIQMGHINLLYGYALTPLAVVLFLRFFKHPSKKRALYASLTACTTILLSVHHIILTPIIVALCIWNQGDNKKISPSLYAWLIGPFLITAALIIGALYLTPSSAVRTLDYQDLAIFAPQPQCTSSSIIDTVLLTAQWRNPHATPTVCAKQHLFFATNALCILAMMIGAWKKKKLAISAFILIILADIPFLLAMRDSAKYIADLVIIESVLLAYGIMYLSTLTKNKVASLLALIIVCVGGLPMFWGLSETIIPRQYPASWYTWENKLADLPQKPIVLFLPWHMYMPFDFTNQVTIANPASRFFLHATIIQGDNLEMRQQETAVQSESHSSQSQAIQNALASMDTPQFPNTFRTLLTTQHIAYITLASGSPEEAQYRIALNSLPYLHPIIAESGLSVWQFGE